jgi:hypothetical protein
VWCSKAICLMTRKWKKILGSSNLHSRVCLQWLKSPYKRPHLLKDSPPPNNTKLETKPLTHGPLVNTIHPIKSIAMSLNHFLPLMQTFSSSISYF